MRFNNIPRWIGNPMLQQRARRMASCRGKHRHKSRGAAEAHLRALARRYQALPPMRAYLCPACWGWHVGRVRRTLTDTYPLH
jgi:hypothetical protein